VILGEAAILRHIGGRAVMRRQLEALVDAVGVSDSPWDFRMFPLSMATREEFRSSFTILEFPDSADGQVVQVDDRWTTTYLEGEVTVTRHAHLFDEIGKSALSRSESIERLLREIDELRA
jgi:hypothetical protein